MLETKWVPKGGSYKKVVADFPPTKIWLKQLKGWKFLFLFHSLKGFSQEVLSNLWPYDCSPPGSSVHGILQARILERVAISFSRGILPTQGSKSSLLHCTWILYCWATREARFHSWGNKKENYLFPRDLLVWTTLLVHGKWLLSTSNKFSAGLYIKPAYISQSLSCVLYLYANITESFGKQSPLSIHMNTHVCTYIHVYTLLLPCF